MPQELQRALKNIGLSDKEISVLYVLLQNGPLLVSAIAKEARLNRTTAYGLLKELSARGLVSSNQKKGAVRYQSIAPSALPGYIERRREELSESKREILGLIPQLMLLRTKGKSLPKVQFYEGKEGFEQAYEEIIDNNKEKQLLAITGLDAVFTKLDPKFVSYFLNKRTALGIRVTDIAPDTEWGRKSQADDKKYLRVTKFIPPEFTFDSELLMFDNKVAIFSYAPERPVAVIIEDDTISHAMRTLFKYMLSTAR